MVFLIARLRRQNGGISTSGSPYWTIPITSRYLNPVDEYPCVRMEILLLTFGTQIWRCAQSPKLAAAPN